MGTNNFLYWLGNESAKEKEKSGKKAVGRKGMKREKDTKMGTSTPQKAVILRKCSMDILVVDSFVNSPQVKDYLSLQT